MRRIAWLLIGCGSVSMAFATAALGEASASYADRFDQSSYAGSNGSLAWGGPWIEVGESDGPSAGAVRVASDTGCSSGRCLKITSAMLELEKAGAARFADTSVFTTAKLTFDMASETLGLGGLVGALTGASFTVEVTIDSGSSWTVIYHGDLLDFLEGGASKVLSLDPYLAAGFGVRFLAQDLLGGEVMVDDVEITGLHPVPTTTVPTTTTIPTTTTVPTTTVSTRPSVRGALPEPDSSTTTTTPRPSTTDPRDPTMTTTQSTDEASPVLPVGPGGDPPPSTGTGGLRTSESGVQADSGGFSFRPVDLAAGHRSAVERITSGWLSLAGLAMIVTGASVFGVDKRRGRVGRKLPDD